MSQHGNRRDETRVGRDIRAPKVRVIAEDGEQLGILDTREALGLAADRGLDLVEVSPTARPPVCKLMDWGKHKYSTKKRAAEAKKRQHQMLIKEIKLRPKTDQHDRETKLRHVRRFIGEGHGVKLTMRFRGREIIYAESAMEQLFAIAREVTEEAQIQSHPNMEGRNMSMVLVPRKKQER